MPSNDTHSPPPRRQFLRNGAAVVGSALGAQALPKLAQAATPVAPAAAHRAAWSNWSGLQKAQPLARPMPADEAAPAGDHDQVVFADQALDVFHESLPLIPR